MEILNEINAVLLEKIFGKNISDSLEEVAARIRELGGTVNVFLLRDSVLLRFPKGRRKATEFYFLKEKEDDDNYMVIIKRKGWKRGREKEEETLTGLKNLTIAAWNKNNKPGLKIEAEKNGQLVSISIGSGGVYEVFRGEKFEGNPPIGNKRC